MEVLTLGCVCKTAWWGRTENYGLLVMGEATRYVSLEQRRLKGNKSVRPPFRRALFFSRRWEIVKRQIPSEYEQILRIRAIHLNGQHQEVVNSVSTGWMAFRCFKGIGCCCWSWCCTLSLPGDLRGPFQVMVSYQVTMVTTGLPSVQLWGAGPTQDHQKFLKPKENTVISHHIVTYFVRGEADKLASSVREMGWMQLNHSFFLSILLISQASTCFYTRILYFPLKTITFSFPVSPACYYFSTPNF